MAYLTTCLYTYLAHYFPSIQAYSYTINIF